GMFVRLMVTGRRSGSRVTSRRSGSRVTSRRSGSRVTSRRSGSLHSVAVTLLGPVPVLVPVKTFTEANLRLPPALPPPRPAGAARVRGGGVGAGHGRPRGQSRRAPPHRGCLRRPRRRGMGPCAGRAGHLGAGAGPQPGRRGRRRTVGRGGRPAGDRRPRRPAP